MVIAWTHPAGSGEEMMDSKKSGLFRVVSGSVPATMERKSLSSFAALRLSMAEGGQVVHERSVYTAFLSGQSRQALGRVNGVEPNPFVEDIFTRHN